MSASDPSTLPEPILAGRGPSTYEDLVTDGGVFDNLGYDAVRGRDGRVIISDAGARFDLPPDRWIWRIIARASRATDILMERIGDKAIHSIANADNVKCVQLGKQSAKGGLLTPEVEASVARIRTDLDYFSSYETGAQVLNGFRNALSILGRSRYFPSADAVLASRSRTK